MPLNASTHTRAVITLASAFCLSAQAGILRDNLKIFPETIASGSEFLLLVDDAWSSGCGGELRLEVSATRIHVIADESATANQVCTAVVVPFQRLFHPRASLPAGSAFASTVDVRYTRILPGASNYVEDQSITFQTAPSVPFILEPGSFVSPSLPSSGLFIDQQANTMTLNLSDYDADGSGVWFYGSGRVNGNVFVGPASSFRTIQCVQAPCPRVAADRNGQVLMLALDQNNLLVDYGGLLSAPYNGFGTFAYRRFDFTPGNLPSIESVGYALPELQGRWLGGVTSTAGFVGQLSEYDISYAGADDSEGLRSHRFLAATRGAGGGPAFTVRCVDARPVDGPIACTVDAFAFRGFTCEISFAPDETGPTGLSTPATCTERGNSVETRFVLRRY